MTSHHAAVISLGRVVASTVGEGEKDKKKKKKSESLEECKISPVKHSFKVKLSVRHSQKAFQISRE